jgi:hypothetical protein
MKTIRTSISVMVRRPLHLNKISTANDLYMNISGLRKTAFGLIFSLVSLTASAQTIYGPSPVGLNSTYTYSYGAVDPTAFQSTGETTVATEGNGSNKSGGEVIALVGDPPPPGSMTWSVTKGTILSSWVSDNTNYVSVKWTATGTGTLKILYQGGTVASKNVTINSCSGLTGPTGTSASRCGPGNVTLSATKSGYSIRWYSTSGGSTTVATGSSFTPFINSTTTYYAAGYNSTTGCETPRTAVTGTIISAPTANAGADLTGSTTCGASSIAMAGNTPTAGTGLWTIVSGTGGALTSPSSATATLNGVNGNSYVLRWTITNGSCSAYDEVAVTLNLKPDAQANNNIFFSGNTTGIAITGTVPGTTFTWTSSGTGVTGHSSGSGVSIVQTLKTSSEVATATYTITPVTTICTGLPITATATVHGVPQITGTSDHAGVIRLFFLYMEKRCTATDFWCYFLFDSVCRKLRSRGDEEWGSRYRRV